MSKSLTDPWWVKKGLSKPPTLLEADSQAKRMKAKRITDYSKALEASVYLSEFITKYELEGTWDFQDVLDELDTFIINLMDEDEK